MLPSIKGKGFTFAYQKSARENIHKVERFITNRPPLKKTLKDIFQAKKKMILEEMQKRMKSNQSGKYVGKIK